VIEKYREKYTILVERLSKTTKQNKQNLEIIVRKLLEIGYKPKKITIVTDELHVTRARAIFGKQMYGIPIEYYHTKYPEKGKDLLYELVAFAAEALGLTSIAARLRK
jgi:uncharacterized SAM-binding protein YcdF (DUF218 family)